MDGIGKLATVSVMWKKGKAEKGKIEFPFLHGFM